MDLRTAGDSESRFSAYVEGLVSVIGHADRAGPLRDYCVGLMMPCERKSVEPMAAMTAPGRTAAQHQSLLHFVGNAAWSDEKVLTKVRAMVLPAIERHGPIEAWIIDDTGFPKKGEHSVGVARQYCGQLGKQDNCQVAVSLSLANHYASLPAAYRLYLPEDWAGDSKRRCKAGVPEDVRFKTKPEIALEQIDAACKAGLARGACEPKSFMTQQDQFRVGRCHTIALCLIWVEQYTCQWELSRKQRHYLLPTDLRHNATQGETIMNEEALPAGTTLLVKGGQALTPSANWHTPPLLDIAIAGDTIAGISAGYRIDGRPDLEVIHARDHLVLPGFINAHYHSHDVLAKGTLEEEIPLETWRLYALPPARYPPRSSEEVYARTLLGALECVRSGMTTIQDMLTLYPYDDHHMDAVMAAYDKVGIRVVFALQYADRKGIETVAVLEGHFSPGAPSASFRRHQPEIPAGSVGETQQKVPPAGAGERTVEIVGAKQTGIAG